VILRPERERGRDPAPVDNPARGDDRHRHRVDDLRHKSDEADEPVLERANERPAVAARLRALCDDDINPGPRKRGRLLRCCRRAHQDNALKLVERRDSEGEAEHRHPLLGHDRELVDNRPAWRHVRLRLG
jgi:hypothetical protein